MAQRSPNPTGEDQVNNILEKYDLIGEKFSHIITYASAIVDGEGIDPLEGKVRQLKTMFTTCGFRMGHEPDKGDMDDDSVDDASAEDCGTAVKNLSPLHLARYLKDLVKKKHNAKCIAMYIIAPQVGHKMYTQDRKPLPLFRIWEELKDLRCPKLFFIHALCESNAQGPLTLLNSNEENDEGNSLRLPKSSNVLLAYFPDYGEVNVPIAKILSDELSKPFNINACLTSAISEMESRNCRGTPKFASTLHKQLHLGNSNSHDSENALGGCQSYNISDKKKCFVFVFLIEHFEDGSDLSQIMHGDRRNLESTFNDLGFTIEFCVHEGIITAKEFHWKLREIVGDKEKMQSAECVMIVISSHGDEDGVIKTYFGDIQLDDVCQKFSECADLNGKPKLIVVDACRGEGYDEPQSPTVSHKGSKSVNLAGKKEHVVSSKMKDMLLALSSTEGTKSYGICGSFFMTSLCDKLRKYGARYDMLTILNLTMTELGHRNITDINEDDCEIVDVKQQATFTSTLQKLLYFPNARNNLNDMT